MSAKTPKLSTPSTGVRTFGFDANGPALAPRPSTPAAGVRTFGFDANGPAPVAGTPKLTTDNTMPAPSPAPTMAAPSAAPMDEASPSPIGPIPKPYGTPGSPYGPFPPNPWGPGSHPDILAGLGPMGARLRTGLDEVYTRLTGHTRPHGTGRGRRNPPTP